MNPIETAGELVGPIVQEVYSDGVSSAMKEVGKIGQDAVKTVRLALFPIQFAAALQDRLASYIERAVNMVPPERRVPPVQSFALIIMDRLRHQEPDSILTEMYIQLLARAFDKERVGEAHPAFIHIIGQLAPDEALIIEQLSRFDFSIYIYKNSNKSPYDDEDRKNLFNSIPARFRTEGLYDKALRSEELGQPKLAGTYLEHLITVGLVDRRLMPAYTETRDVVINRGIGFDFVGLNQFGRLFHLACSPNTDGERDIES